MSLYAFFYLQFKNEQLINLIRVVTLVDIYSFILFYLGQAIISFVFFYSLKPRFLYFIVLIFILWIYIRIVYMLSMIATLYLSGVEDDLIIMYYWSPSLGEEYVALSFLMFFRVALFKILRKYRIIHIEN